jgi:hypothetical protein
MIVNVLGVLSCLAADTQALMWRAALRCRYALRRTARGIAKAILPEVIVQEIRRRRERAMQAN